MSTNRKLVRVYTPNDEPGFLGPDHKARHLVRGDFKQTDPFILLMDDMLDKRDENPVGGEHPHAGFETVSLLLEGQMGDTKHKMKSGDFQIMTAGSGIVHTETIDRIARMRLLQLWLNLPKKIVGPHQGCKIYHGQIHLSYLKTGLASRFTAELWQVLHHLFKISFR